MPRPKKEYKPISCKISKDTYDKLEEMCSVVGFTKTKAIEKALERYYKEFKSKRRSVL